MNFNPDATRVSTERTAILEIARDAPDNRPQRQGTAKGLAVTKVSTPPAATYPHLFAPLALRSVTLPNRLVMGSMHTRLECEPDGAERLAAFYAERAQIGRAHV